ncbi:Lyso-phosphatidylcholine acyltransferase [Paecilomyces lecythidis]|uniref:Lyso-phosphatidylcholine acyltransferase n=1 Tax=Paecilomyces lecythidis TaxID=3004212 RepID=A0ABR3Y963_9EURO
MPKKHQKYSSIKPTSLPHHSLSPGNHTSRHQHGASSSTPEPSVNDLINHLRRTQLSQSSSGDGAVSYTPRVVPRSVHPSIRNLLELPETPPPRPRPSPRRVGDVRIRRTPGPPPPSSWLRGSHTENNERNHERLGIPAGSGRVLYRLERLPGVTFPAKDSLQHAVLKSMASNWNWHLDYDGEFLSELPTRMRILLLSYITVYAHNDQAPRNRGQGLRPLFSKQEGDGWPDQDHEVTRLDLSAALGNWISLKQLNAELVVSSSRGVPSSVIKVEENVPSSWDAELEEESDTAPTPSLLQSPVQTLRFENLRHLSLAHPNKTSASWISLLHLLSHLSTLTHLSLAHWPVPTLTPNAINSRVRHPTHRSLTFSYGGTDAYSAFENNWAEASSVLRKLSRATYCLKWLDLEGCGDWFGALSWDGIGPDGEVYNSPGPEWNASWRNVEWVGLGPGWLPGGQDSGEYGASPSKSLYASIHSPLSSSIPPDPALNWNVEEEREKYRRAKEMGAYRDILDRAKRVQEHIRRVRREEKGKWVHVSFGGDGPEERAMLKTAGVDVGF